jgi:hypothetical protein
VDDFWWDRAGFGVGAKTLREQMAGVCKTRQGLGQDGADMNFGLDPSLVDFSPPSSTFVDYPAAPDTGLIYSPGGVNVPPGYGYGPSPSGGVAIYPAGSATSSPSSGGGSDLSWLSSLFSSAGSVGKAVLAPGVAPRVNVPTGVTPASIASPVLGGLSLGTILLAGAALVLVMSMGRR